MSRSAHSDRLFVLSNRLPVTIKKGDDGEWTFKESSGGLVAALSGLKKMMQFTWIGWPGFEVSSEDRMYVRQRLKDDFSCVPVFLPNSVSEPFYSGFSNGVLWPLFHYLPAEVEFKEEQWTAYESANIMFSEALAEVCVDDSLVWVHDYHLMLLPAMLRKATKFSNIKIGFFLHTPFPTSEIYRVLPVRNELLNGVIQCDLVGFHTYEYARHFMTACSQLLGSKTSPNGVINASGMNCEVGTFPIGIEPDIFYAALEDAAVKSRIEELKKRVQNCSVILGVDRLDYIKGVPQKLYAFDMFLSKNPHMRGKIALIQVAVPTREDVEEYLHLKSLVEGLVGQINGKYSTADYTPIHYLYHSIDFNELAALYQLADACLVSSTRDGMNLVAYEYVASQKGHDGVLILSEFAGAAQSLYGAILVNPWDIASLSDAIGDALSMPEEQRRLNMNRLQQYVSKFTSAHWGCAFVERLQAMKGERADLELDLQGFEPKRFIFDLNVAVGLGSYANYVNAVAARFPDNPIYVIIGGSDFPFEQLASRVRILNCCEKCVPWDPAACDSILDWMHYYSQRTPGTHIIKSKDSLEWVFSKADPAFAAWQAAQLLEVLKPAVKKYNLFSTLECSSVKVSTGFGPVESKICEIVLDVDDECAVVFGACARLSVNQLAARLLSSSYHFVDVCRAGRDMSSHQNAIYL